MGLQGFYGFRREIDLVLVFMSTSEKIGNGNGIIPDDFLSGR